MKAILSEIIGEQYPIISEEFIEVGNYTDYYKFLDCEIFTCVTTHYKGEELSIFVDDEGLLKPNYGRMVVNYPEPLFGNIVICGGVDTKGNTLDIPESIRITDLEEIVSGIKYETIG